MKILLPILLGGILLLGCKDNGQKKQTVEVTAVDTSLFSQSVTKIIPIEHATLVLEWNDITIYIDPVGGPEAFEGQKEPNLILITDIHGDHLSVETLEALNTKNAKLVVPEAVAEKLPDNFTPQTDVLNNGDTREYEGITIEAVPMYNLRKEALEFHTKGRGNGYILNLGEKRFYFSGDTEDISEMRALKNIDKAFICMNLPYTMTPESAADAVLEFQPKQVYPYHYRGKPDVSDVEKFKSIVEASNSDIEVVQYDWYPNDDF